MHPEDRVLVGVINRKKDFLIAQEQHWYRIPYGKAPKGIHAEYIAFFFSSAFGELNGSIHYYARKTGLELATRAELLPEESDHPRAAEVYHKLQFRELQAKVPPILNTSKRRLSFIYTTWDRFVHATTIDDLYSEADHLVDRVFYALEDAGYRPMRRWEAELGYPTQAAQVRVLCQNGEVVASTFLSDGIPITHDLDTSLHLIKQQVAELGGPRLLPLPVE